MNLFLSSIKNFCIEQFCCKKKTVGKLLIRSVGGACDNNASSNMNELFQISHSNKTRRWISSRSCKIFSNLSIFFSKETIFTIPICDCSHNCDLRPCKQYGLVHYNIIKLFSVWIQNLWECWFLFFPWLCYTLIL